MEQYLKQGLVSDSKVLDIRQVDVRHFLHDVGFAIAALTVAPVVFPGLIGQDTGE